MQPLISVELSIFSSISPYCVSKYRRSPTLFASIVPVTIAAPDASTDTSGVFVSFVIFTACR